MISVLILWPHPTVALDLKFRLPRSRFGRGIDPSGNSIEVKGFVDWALVYAV